MFTLEAETKIHESETKACLRQTYTPSFAGIYLCAPMIMSFVQIEKTVCGTCMYGFLYKITPIPSIPPFLYFYKFMVNGK